MKVQIPMPLMHPSLVDIAMHVECFVKFVEIDSASVRQPLLPPLIASRHLIHHFHVHPDPLASQEWIGGIGDRCAWLPLASPDRDHRCQH